MSPEEVGCYLKELRLNHKLTQKELAAKLHITHQAVSNWEKGKAIPDITILTQLSNIYGVSIDNILLKQESVEVNKNLVLKRILAFLGLLFSLTFFSIFLHFNRDIVITIIFVTFMMILSVSYSYIMKKTRTLLEYGIFTLILLITFIVIFLSNPRFYMLNTTKYMKLVEETEILYLRYLEPKTKVVLYENDSDQHAILYNEGTSNFDIFNITTWYEGTYETVDTGDMKIYDMVNLNDTIYFTTFNEEIPGEFKLYTFNKDTLDYTLMYESQDVLRLYTAFEQLYLISDPYLEPQTKVYEYNFEEEEFFPPIELDFLVYGLAEHFVDYESYLLLSVTNLDKEDHRNTIGLFDYDFTLKKRIYEGEPGMVHHLFHKYGRTFIDVEEGAIYFIDETYVNVGEGSIRYPDILSRELLRLEDKIYYIDGETNEYSLLYETLFYDEEFYELNAYIMIYDETLENFVVLDNDFIGRVEQIPYELDEVLLHSTFRVVFLGIGIFSYGFFITLGHKKKKTIFKKK